MFTDVAFGKQLAVEEDIGDGTVDQVLVTSEGQRESMYTDQ